MAATTPTVFHDATVASSGVANCVVSTPSMCNNSIPGSTGQSGGQAGYLLTAGYDEVTGLGLLDIDNFIDNFQAPPAIKIVYHWGLRDISQPITWLPNFGRHWGSEWRLVAFGSIDHRGYGAECERLCRG